MLELSDACAGILGAPPSAPLVLLVQRVLERICKPDELSRISETDWQPDHVVRLFRTHQLLPGRLLTCVPDPSPPTWPSRTSFAVAFAASLYPNRASLEELPDRTRSFVAATEHGPFTPLEPVLNKLLERSGLDPDRLRSLLCDLTATTDGPTAVADPRFAGAVYHAATFPRELWERIARNWSEDGSLLRFLRNPSFLVPPSSRYLHEVGFQRSGSPHWDGLDVVLHRDHDPLPWAVKPKEMEIVVWHAKPFDCGPDLYVDLAQAFWMGRLDKLQSGFSYYGFQSRFLHWWKQCAINFAMEIPKPEIELTAAAGAVQQTELRDLIVVLREGARLVRNTFSNRPPQVLDGTADYVIDKYFGSTDTIDGSGLPADTVQRFDKRLQAYYVGRAERLSNRQVNALGQSFEEVVHRLCASLGRIIRPHRLFLPPVLAHGLIWPTVDPQHAESWDTPRCVSEVTAWLSDPVLFDRNATHAIDERIRRLRSLWLHKSGAINDHFANAVRDTVEDRGFAFIQRWPKDRWNWYRDRDHAHWIPPLWYLHFCERVTNDNDMLARLVVDRQDVNIVLQLFTEMKTFTLPGSGALGEVRPPRARQHKQGSHGDSQSSRQQHRGAK